MTGFATRGWGSSRLVAAKYCATELDVTSSTTLTNIPNLSHVLQSGAQYIIEAHITGTAGASGGAKVALAASGGLTATNFTATASNTNGTTQNARGTTTTLGSAIGGATAAMTDVIILGSINVATGGVLTLQLAQNASNGTATAAYVGSYLKVTRAYV